jgi:hypothetical protein
VQDGLGQPAYLLQQKRLEQRLLVFRPVCFRAHARTWLSNDVHEPDGKQGTGKLAGDGGSKGPPAKKAKGRAEAEAEAGAKPAVKKGYLREQLREAVEAGNDMRSGAHSPLKMKVYSFLHTKFLFLLWFVVSKFCLV